MGKSLLHGELILAIDFDGTITTEPDMGNELVLREDCKRVIKRLHEDGFRLILWTCRTGKSFEEAMTFLEKEGLHDVFCSVNDQLKEVNELYHPDVARKVGADFYIDDKNILSDEVDWNKIEEFIYG